MMVFATEYWLQV